ncbi:hypothetical protein AB0M46_06570 [Dactylosporangium sp. NPDC051485]|uniref:hypothetical protein n=1 Tax=Dactylosporangium sp. NPDC051485 TaxID=3154846 RepID=UPI003429F33E
MVVRLVRAGVGALLLLIAVPLALAGGGLLLAMEHRAADGTFTARLEPIRTGGSAVVVPDVDALLRADAPFARGGQTTLSLSARGSGGPLFIGLGPDEDVERYLAGVDRSRLSRVRLSRGSLPVDLSPEPVRLARTNAPAAPASPINPASPANPAITGGDALPADGAQAGGPPAEPDATQPEPEPGTTRTAKAQIASPANTRPADLPFWLARSEQKAGAAELTWSPSAMRGRHLALVIMRADATPGIDAAVTARLAPAWLGPTTGGLLMLGSALFVLALITLAWPPARRPALAGLPALPTQPTTGPRDEPPSAEEPKTEEPKAEKFRAEEPKAEKPEAGKSKAEKPKAEKPEAGEPEAGKSKAEEAEAEEPEVEEPKAEKAGEADETACPKGPSESVLATLADVLAVADAEAKEAKVRGAKAEPTRDEILLTESELDRPAPKDVELDGDGPIALPPLPALPPIELQFTWAPIALSDEPTDGAANPVKDRDPAGSGSAAR